TVTITFKAAALGTYSGTLTITGQDDVSATVALSATVVDPYDDSAEATKHGQLTSWTVNQVEQNAEYAGLGNSNELLATATVSLTSGTAPQLIYKLYANANFGATSKFIKRIKVYARERDTDQDYTPDNSYASYENTFAHVYDYRDPINNLGAVLLGSTEDIPAAGETATFTSNLALAAGDYLLYLVADMKMESELENGLADLPAIGGTQRNYTRFGGTIYRVMDGDNTYTMTKVNNYSSEGGGRVLIPKHKILYAPQYTKYASSIDYSKYYRIPAIAKAANGSLVALSDARKDHIHDITNNIDVVFRRSTDNGRTWGDYVVIFQGSDEGSDDCVNHVGYGDAAIAAFPNGTLIATAINGYGLSGTSSTTTPTDVVWKCSYDNGKTWTVQYTLDHSLFGNLRGCISPGSICVAEGGAIGGKAIAALRTSTGVNTGASVSASHYRVYLLTYDPATNTWANLKDASGNILYVDNASGDYDEAHLAQVADNTFVLSMRSYISSDSYRAFRYVTLSDATTATVSDAAKSGMTLANGCNGDIMAYSAENGEYLMHTVPKDMVYSGDNCRSSLAFYYANKVESGTIAWNRSLTLSDPYDNTNGGTAATGIGAVNESAQYSSITEQKDHTIGMLYEGYPLAIRHKDNVSSTYNRHWGDWVMAQYYLNFRVEDLIPDAVTPEEQSINAPVITPDSRLFDNTDATSRPEITISHDNYEALADLYAKDADNSVTTYYGFQLFKGNELLSATTAQNFVPAESATFTWAQVLGALGLDADPIDATADYVLRVNSYCMATEDANVVSSTTTAVYRFTSPVRNVKVVGVPSSGAGNITLLATGISVGPDEWALVKEGVDVAINAPANTLYTFKGWYYAYTNESSNEPLNHKLPYSTVSGIAHQIQFTMPSANVTPDNDADGLIIYAVYDVKAGMATRVSTQYNAGNPTVVGDEEDWSNVGPYYSFYTPTEDFRASIATAVSGQTFATDLEFPNPEQQNNLPTFCNQKNDVNLYYPQKLNLGLDAFVTVVPDVYAASNFNAIVAVKKGDTYLSDFYVLQGYNHPMPASVTTRAKAVYNWYDFADGQLVPKAVGFKSYEVGYGEPATSKRKGKAWYKAEGDLNFAGICAEDEAFDGEVDVDIFLVYENQKALSAGEYIYKMTHPILRDPDVETEVTDVDATKTVAKVTYYNVLGVPATIAHKGVNVVVTTYTDGTTSTQKVLK
ncbi:MAG: sialidase family protein, partial [Sodaliphilus sp.]